jgi:glycosyltransferase involved in cell wall biosynthesis
MRVLFLVQQFWPYVGGLEVWASRLLPGLIERGHEVAVVTSHAALTLPDRDRYKGMEILRLPLRTALESNDVQAVVAMRRAVADLKRRFAPDLVHVNLTGPIAWLHLLTADGDGPPVLVSLHDPLEGRGADADSLFGRALRSADWVTAGSSFVLEEARRLLPALAARSSLVYQGYDPPTIPRAPLPSDPARLLCVGRHIPGKGFDVAIAALARILSDFPGTRLTIASDGPARSSLEQQVRVLGLAAFVEFPGWIEFDRMPCILNAATIVLVPSRIPEGFGLVALEAALMERPVIATRSGALPEVVADGETGLLVDHDDPAALADAIAFLLGRRDVATSMGQAGRRRAEALFGLQSHIDRFDAVYWQIAGASVRP